MQIIKLLLVVVFQYNTYVHSVGIMYAIFKNDNRRLSINNKIFEIILYNYMIAKQHLQEIGKRLSHYTSSGMYLPATRIHGKRKC